MQAGTAMRVRGGWGMVSMATRKLVAFSVNVRAQVSQNKRGRHNNGVAQISASSSPLGC